MSGYAHVRNGSKCEILRTSRCFPLRLRTRTLLDAIGTSHLCQKQKLTPARTADDWRDENPTELVPVKTDDGAGGYADPAGDKAFGKAGSRLQRR